MVTIDIDISDIDEFKNGFLKAVPKTAELDHLSDLEFFKEWLQTVIFNAYKTGKIMIAKEATTPDITPDIVTVS